MLWTRYEVKNMSQKNAQSKQQQKCKLQTASNPEENVIYAAESSSVKVLAQKRKDEAEQTLYLNRV
jgi:hypothetical protein